MASPDKRIQKNRHFLASLRHALDGLRAVTHHEGNFRRELMAALVVLAAGWYFQVTRFDWVLIVVAICLVFLFELANTIVEALVDLVVGPHYDPQAKLIKDMAAGAVLLAAVIALACGVYVFGPHVWALIAGGR
ncbi:MAG: diacylglycerol kinase [Lactobacillus sp.]|nr:diacylglycerol kinase [Lactobacillus sp.]MCI2034184.1 diacylglycerol kinase [Lactobacillus sp.]